MGNPKTLFQENILGRFLRHAGFRTKIRGITGWKSLTQRSHNLIPDIGHFSLAQVVAGDSGSPQIAIGSGNTAPSSADTGLESQVALMYVAYPPTYSTTNVTNDTVVFTATFSMTVAAAIGEECLRLASQFFARQTFTPIAVNVGDIVTVTHTVVC